MNNNQVAPFPVELDLLVKTCQFRPGWSIALYPDYDRGQGSRGLTVSVVVDTVNSYEPHEAMRVNHLFPVPPAAYDARSWQRWLFERLREVDSHEAAEFYTVDGVKPYAPSHGPGNDPYLIRELGTDIDVRTAYTGELDR